MNRDLILTQGSGDLLVMLCRARIPFYEGMFSEIPAAGLDGAMAHAGPHRAHVLIGRDDVCVVWLFIWS
jgi:hypothetical protein